MQGAGGIDMRPSGSSVLAPFLRKLAENPNEHGEGRLAEEVANILMARLLGGQPVGDILKALERTDGAVKTQIEHSAVVVPPIEIRGATAEQFAAIQELANGPAR